LPVYPFAALLIGAPSTTDADGWSHARLVVGPLLAVRHAVRRCGLGCALIVPGFTLAGAGAALVGLVWSGLHDPPIAAARRACAVRSP